MKLYIANEKGSTLLIVMGLLLMLTVIGSMAVNTSTTDIELSFNQVHGDKAFYIAEAGAKRAIAEIRADKTWIAGFTDEALSGGLYSVLIEDSSITPALDDTIIVTALATLEAAKAEIEIMLAPEYFYPFRYAMFGKDSMHIKNSMMTDSYDSDSGVYPAAVDTLYGDVGSNGWLSVCNGATIGGDAVTSLTGGASVHPGATVTGEVRDDIPEQIPPDIPQSEFDWAELNNDALTNITPAGDFNPATDALLSSGDVTLTEGTYFFSSIILKNTANLIIPPGDNVKIYVTGDIELKNSAAVNDGGSPSSLIIYSQGDFVLKNSGDIFGTFYNPNGSADLRNSGEFYGSVVAGFTHAHNSAGFHYDRNLGKKEKKETGNIQLVAWKEN